MKVRYRNLQDDLDPMSGTSFEAATELVELLEGRRKKLPFIAKLSGDNGFELAIGIGRIFGCAQYSSSDGNSPYLMAVSPHPPMKRGGFEFLTANTPTAIPARYVVRFKELKETARHFLETDGRSDQVAWQELEHIKEAIRGPWRPSARPHVLRLLGQLDSKRIVDGSLNLGAAKARQGVRYGNLQNSFDQLNGTTATERHQLTELLEGAAKEWALRCRAFGRSLAFASCRGLASAQGLLNIVRSMVICRILWSFRLSAA